MPFFVYAAIALGGAAIGSAASELYDRLHFGSDGFNGKGFDREGYDREGFNREGFNREGFDRRGFDRRGYDVEGYNRQGFDKNGFDREGYDRAGYARDGFNIDGYDRAGNDRSYYEQSVQRIEGYVREAKEQRRNGRNGSKDAYVYALIQVRKGLERGMKCIYAHNMGRKGEREKLAFLIDECAGYLDSEMLEKLYSAKEHCNSSAHDEEGNAVPKSDGQVTFCIKTLEELCSIVRIYSE